MTQSADRSTWRVIHPETASDAHEDFWYVSHGPGDPPGMPSRWPDLWAWGCAGEFFVREIAETAAALLSGAQFEPSGRSLFEWEQKDRPTGPFADEDMPRRWIKRADTKDTVARVWDGELARKLVEVLSEQHLAAASEKAAREAAVVAAADAAARRTTARVTAPAPRPGCAAGRRV